MTWRLWLVLWVLALLPLAGRAQFNSYAPGTYILRSAPTEVQQAELKLRGSDELLVKSAGGEKLKLSAKEVLAFRLGTAKYVAVGPFELRIGLGSLDFEEGFARPIDLGEIELLYFEFSEPDRNAAGSAYLLRRGPAGSVVGLTRASGSGGARFREELRPFLASRPDLLKYLDEKRINIDNMVPALRALNHHETFNPPAALNLE